MRKLKCNSKNIQLTPMQARTKKKTTDGWNKQKKNSEIIDGNQTYQ